jgi:hypothetical protein
MKRLFLIFILSSFFCSLKSQTKALTESGREVVLYENGTWKYLVDSLNGNTDDSTELKLNPKAFFKTPASTFLVKSKVFNVGVSINPAKWKFHAPEQGDESIEYQFTSKTNDLFAMMLTEKTDIPLSNMPNIALINAKKASLDVRIVHQEYRMVNDKKILCLELHGTIQGIKFVFLGYYYTNTNGTLQLVGYTSEKLFEQDKKQLEELLNGLTVINN